MKIPKDKEIEQEIEKLEKLKKLVPPRTFFGEDNVAPLITALNVLRDRIEDEDEIYECWPAEDRDGDQRLNEAAVSARSWLVGENEEEAPSHEWRHLLVTGTVKSVAKRAKVVDTKLAKVAKGIVVRKHVKQKKQIKPCKK